MNLPRRILVELIVLTGSNRNGLVTRVAIATIRTVGYWRGYIDAVMWHRFGRTLFEPPPDKRVLGRRK